MAERALVYLGMVWVVVALCAGLWASEMKKRSFWIWFFLSFLTGPISWYLLLFRLSVYIPPDQRKNCPRCGKVMRKDAKRCPHCKSWVDAESKDRAAEMGRQAATMVFTARRLLGSARRAADEAAARRRGNTSS